MSAAYSEMPATNMWCAQTRNPSDGDAEDGERHGLVSEDSFAREAADDLADDAHAGQDHDVDSGVRVEPEQVLEQKRIAAEGRIEDSKVQRTLESDQHERDGDDRGAEHLDDTGRVV